MFNKRIVLTSHVLDQFAKRNFDRVSDIKKIKALVFRDLKPLNIKRIEKEKDYNGEPVYKVWVKGGKQYRIVEKTNKIIVATVIQHNRKSNKYANIK